MDAARPQPRPDRSTPDGGIPTAAHRESGFTLTEVVVAAFVALVILAGFVYFSVSSTRSQSLASVRARQAKVAQAAWEHLNGTASWTTACPTVNVECAISADRFLPALQKLDIELGDIDIVASAVGRNVAADDANNRDRNGAAPDIFDLKVVAVHRTDSPRVSAPVTLGGTFDPTKSGIPGSLVVNVCTMLPQVDDRIRVAGCSPAGNTYVMDPPIDDTATLDAEENAWDALMESPGGLDRTRIGVRAAPTSLQVWLKGPDGATAKQPVGSNGLVEFRDLKPGAYEIMVDGLDGLGLSRAERSSTPASSTAAVTNGTRATSVVVLGPRSVPVEVEVGLHDGADGRQFRLLPLPAGRIAAPLWTTVDPDVAMAAGWAELPESGSESIKVPPGLYVATDILTLTPGGTLELAPAEVDPSGAPDGYEGYYVWIDPTGSAHLPVKPLTVFVDSMQRLGGTGGA